MPGAPRRGTSRVPAISRPNGTPDGQAVSQPRHCTHVSMKPTNASSTGAPCSTARIAAMRPAGEAAPRRSPGRSGSAAGTARSPRRWRGRRRRGPAGSAPASPRRPARVEPAGRVEGGLQPAVQVDHHRVERPAPGRAARRARCPRRPRPRSGPSPRPAGQAAQLRGAQRPAVGRQLGRSVGVDRPRPAAACASTSSGWPSRQAHVVVPSHSSAVGRCSRASASNGSAAGRDPPLVGGERAGAQHHLADEGEGAERADQQPAQVVAADVLHRRAAGRHDRARRGDRPAPRARCRAPARSRGGAPRCGRPPAPRRPSRRASRAGRRSGRARRARRRGRPPVVPARTRTVISAGSKATTPAGARTSRRHRVDAPARPPTGCARRRT